MYYRGACGFGVTDRMGWLAINSRSAVIDPLRALIMAGMYTLTPPSLGFAGRLLIAHLCVLVVIFGDTLRRAG